LSKPKQFLDMADTGKTFIRHTYDRFCKIVPQENILIVTAEKFKNLVLEQIPELDNCNLLLEPYARNTAPCIAYATYKLLQRNPEKSEVSLPGKKAEKAGVSLPERNPEMRAGKKPRTRAREGMRKRTEQDRKNGMAAWTGFARSWAACLSGCWTGSSVWPTCC
jgi:hypothetical protein